jgi:hypothetical protein
MRLTDTAEQHIPELAQKQRTFLMAGAAGAVLTAIGYFTNSHQFFQSYLMGYMLVLGLSLGSLGLAMIHQLSGGEWGIVIRRSAGAASRVIPVLTILFLPIVFGMHDLYEWTHPNWAEPEVLAIKDKYLNVPFFLGRAAFYFVVWNVLVFLLNRWSLEQDRGNREITRKMQAVSAAGIVLGGLCVTFAAFDWMMSIEPHWFSTIYGLLVIIGQLLASIAFQIVMLVWLSKRKPMSEVLQPIQLHDLGNLMLAFTIVWAYFSFSQYLIIWAGNLPEEIEWYVHRLFTGWKFLALALVLFHFFLPFFLLLQRAFKRAPQYILRVAVIVMLVRTLDMFWLIAPDFHKDGFSISWMDVVIPATLFLIWLGCYFMQLRNRPLLPVNDPQFDERLGSYLAHAHLDDAKGAH